MSASACYTIAHVYSAFSSEKIGQPCWSMRYSIHHTFQRHEMQPGARCLMPCCEQVLYNRLQPSTEWTESTRISLSPLPSPSSAAKWTSSASRLELEPTAASSSTSIHHVEQHLWADATHSSAAHSTRKPASATATAKHFRRVDEVFAAVVACALLWVGKRFVRLANVLEAFCCFFVAGVL